MISFPAAFAVFSTILSIFGRTSCHPVKYDQRQEGDLNFRTDIDDVLFVVVPPKDLISTGMNIVAATAANFLKNHYGSGGIERWSHRSPQKTGYGPVEKSPYKIDLEQQKGNVKKINHVGDPNRYNFHENKNPSKGVVLITVETADESALKSSTTVGSIQESVTEGKMEKNTMAEEKKEAMHEEKIKVKPVTKKEPLEEEKMKPLIKKEPLEEEKMKPLTKKEPMEEERIKPLTKKEPMEEERIKPFMKKEPMEEERIKPLTKKEPMEEEKIKPFMKKEPSEEEKMKPLMKKESLGEEKIKSKPSVRTQESRPKTESPIVVVGEFSDGGLGPDSIFAMEGCGPDAYRDLNGLCVYKSVKKKS